MYASSIPHALSAHADLRKLLYKKGRWQIFSYDLENGEYQLWINHQCGRSQFRNAWTCTATWNRYEKVHMCSVSNCLKVCPDDIVQKFNLLALSSNFQPFVKLAKKHGDQIDLYDRK